MKPNKEFVAVRLKSIRKDLGWTIDMMANKLGLAKGTFNSYLRGLALPSEEVVEKVAQLAGTSKEWIYYGDIKDFIKEYLLDKGYGEFLNDYPHVINGIYLLLEKNNDTKSINNYQRTIAMVEDIFEDIYNPIFERYIKDLVNEFVLEIKKYPLYIDDIEYNSQKYYARVLALIDKERPTIRYGESDRILSLAKKEFEIRVELYNEQKALGKIQEESFLDFMIKKLKTYEGKLEVISIITTSENLKFNINSQESAEIIEAFEEFYKALIKINK